MAGDIVFSGVRRNNRKTVGKAFVSHAFPSAFKNVGQAPINQLIHALGKDVASVINAKLELREVLGRVAPGLLAARLAIKARVVPWTIQRLVARVIGQKPPLMRAQNGIGDDVAVRPCTALNWRAQLEQHTGTVRIRIVDIHRRVRCKIGNIGKAVRGIIDPRPALGLRRSAWQNSCGCGPCRPSDPTAQETAATHIHQPITFHSEPPNFAVVSRKCAGAGLLADALIWSCAAGITGISSL
mmetsp:Transcript_155/g.493  ORF Transcript_155/g.493 Transcript_155/m.493 type:complete len:241 (-) Transcript_155:1109-1831(-)